MYISDIHIHTKWVYNKDVKGERKTKSPERKEARSMMIQTLNNKSRYDLYLNGNK
mgnify:CR=1 FL=1